MYARKYTDGKGKTHTKAPKIQRLVTPAKLQRKRRRLAIKKNRIVKVGQTSAACSDPPCNRGLSPVLQRGSFITSVINFQLTTLTTAPHPELAIFQRMHIQDSLILYLCSPAALDNCCVRPMSQRFHIANFAENGHVFNRKRLRPQTTISC